jgi:hypothetical protein
LPSDEDDEEQRTMAKRCNVVVAVDGHWTSTNSTANVPSHTMANATTATNNANEQHQRTTPTNNTNNNTNEQHQQQHHQQHQGIS